jgi:hypothetical protein
MAKPEKIRYDLIETYKELTEPQRKLLVKLWERPKHVVDYYRPLQPLIQHGLVRPRAVSGSFRSGIEYEASSIGAALAEAYRYREDRLKAGIPDDVCMICEGRGIRHHGRRRVPGVRWQRRVQNGLIFPLIRSQ